MTIVQIIVINFSFLNNHFPNVLQFKKNNCSIIFHLHITSILIFLMIATINNIILQSEYFIWKSINNVNRNTYTMVITSLFITVFN